MGNQVRIVRILPIRMSGVNWTLVLRGRAAVYVAGARFSTFTICSELFAHQRWMSLRPRMVPKSNCRETVPRCTMARHLRDNVKNEAIMCSFPHAPDKSAGLFW